MNQNLLHVWEQSPAPKAKRHDSPKKFMLLGAFLIVYNLRDDIDSLYIDFYSHIKTPIQAICWVLWQGRLMCEGTMEKLDRLFNKFDLFQLDASFGL